MGERPSERDDVDSDSTEAKSRMPRNREDERAREGNEEEKTH
jgi:hypothetical protein